MAVTVGEVCTEVRNYFVSAEDIHCETFVIDGGVIAPSDFLLPGQYFRIERSVLNDGIYQYTGEPIESLEDETFLGYIWAMRIPREFLMLVQEISEWSDKYGGTDSVANSPYTSESFAGYSYSKSSIQDANGNAVVLAGDWRSAFRSRLNAWRKI